MTADRFDLARFVTAQAAIYEVAMSELHAGRKQTHWMWFIFPQLRALGRSPTAQFYGLASLHEAAAYLEHPILGPRLKDSVVAVNASAPGSLHALFGSPDDLKFCSSMTLFAAVDPEGPFGPALERWCSGGPDRATIAIIAQD